MNAAPLSNSILENKTIQQNVNTSASYNLEKWMFTVMIISVAAGIWFRIKGLGTWSFSAADEYYMAYAIRQITEYGVPMFESGGYYMRGLIYQYLSVPFLYLGFKEEIAFRIVPVIANLISIPPLYFLGKKIAGKTAAAFVIILFSLSVWETEISRLARYYAPFQAVFLWYLWFLYQATVEKNIKAYKWLFILSFLNIFIYEGSIFLVALNFFPFFIGKSFIKKSYLLVSIALFILAVFYIRIDFRNLGVANYLPVDLKNSGDDSFLPIHLPIILLSTMGENVLWVIPFILLSGVSFFCLYKILTDNYLELYSKIVFISCVLLSLINLFGLAIFTAIIFYLFGWWKYTIIRKNIGLLMLSVVFISLCYWLAYGFFTTTWINFFPEINSFSAKKLLWVLFNYPDLYQNIFYPWYRGMPILTLIFWFGLVTSSLFILLNKFKEQFLKGQRIFLSILLFLCIAITVLYTPYQSVRYSFFIYPLALLVIVLALRYLTELPVLKGRYPALLFIAFAGIFIFLSEDLNLKHLVNIDNQEVNFRTVYNHNLAEVYYFREDYKTPSAVINKNSNKSDIIVTTQTLPKYYLKRLDYFYYNYKNDEFGGRARNKGKQEIWTDANLIYKEENLFSLLSSSDKTIWLINFSNKRYGVSKEEQVINRDYKKYLFYVNLDSTVNVFRIPPQATQSLSNENIYEIKKAANKAAL